MSYGDPYQETTDLLLHNNHFTLFSFSATLHLTFFFYAMNISILPVSHIPVLNESVLVAKSERAVPEGI